MGVSKGKKTGTIRAEFNDFPYYRTKQTMFFDGKVKTKFQPVDVAGVAGYKPLRIKTLKTGLIDRSYPANYVSQIEGKTNEVLAKMERLEYKGQYEAFADFETKVKGLADKVMNGTNEADIANVRRLLDVFNSEHTKYPFRNALKNGEYLKMIESGRKTAKEVVGILERAKVEVPKEISDLAKVVEQTKDIPQDKQNVSDKKTDQAKERTLGNDKG